MKVFIVVIGFVSIGLFILILFRKCNNTDDDTIMGLKPQVVDSFPKDPVPVPNTLIIFERCWESLIKYVDPDYSLCSKARVYGDGIKDTISLDDFKLYYNKEDYEIVGWDSLSFLAKLEKSKEDPKATAPPSFCDNWEDLKYQAIERVSKLQGYISDIAGERFNYQQKKKRISEAMNLFINEDVTIQIMPDKKMKNERKAFILKEYFEWLRFPKNNTTLEIEWVDEVTISDFVFDDTKKLYKALASFTQTYRKFVEVDAPDVSRKEQIYFDVTHKSIEIYLKKGETPNGEGCLILLGNVYANEVE